MGKIKRVAAAGFYIPLAPPVGTENLFAQLQDILRQLHPNSRILLMANSLSFVTYSPQNPPVLLPLKTVCLAWDNPLSSISGRKRYNTLYFASKVVCQMGALPPLETPTRKGGTLPLHGAHTAFSCYPALRLYRLSKSQRGNGVVSLTLGNSRVSSVCKVSAIV